MPSNSGSTGGLHVKQAVSQVRTRWFPFYSTVRHLLPILDGVPLARVRILINDIWDQTGSPTHPVDWSDPDVWIAERLTGDSAALAEQIWRQSKKRVNPRHINGAYLLIIHYELLEPDGQGVFRQTDRGRLFLSGEHSILHEIDTAEGVLFLLGSVAVKQRAKFGDLLEDWAEFLAQHSAWKASSMVRDSLRRRLNCMVERGLLLHEGAIYQACPNGLDYLNAETDDLADSRRDVLKAANQYNSAQRNLLRERLRRMTPYRFERLVGEMLEAMGYEHVTVTKQSGDKGVDVVATVQFGITMITEVVQVKRTRGAVNRHVLDQLRGALPYFKALRGTIITLGEFSKGCAEASLFPGAAPIGLINGDKVLDLLIEHEIGLSKRPIPLFEVDEEYFKQEADEQDDFRG